MAEANATLHLTPLRASMALDTNVRARQVALNAAKLKLRAQGFHVHEFSHRELRTYAEAYLADHREELITEAKADVERWTRKGLLGKRYANIKTSEQRRKA
jgi:hypothetical protein